MFKQQFILDSSSWAVGSTIYRKVFTRSETKESDCLPPTLRALGCTEDVGPASKQQAASIQRAESHAAVLPTALLTPVSHTHFPNTGIHALCEVGSHHHLLPLVTLKEKIVYLHILQFDKFIGVCYHVGNSAPDRQASLSLSCHKFLYSSS